MTDGARSSAADRLAFAIPPLPDPDDTAGLDPADPDDRAQLIRAAHPEHQEAAQGRARGASPQPRALTPQPARQEASTAAISPTSSISPAATAITSL
jgi:hypothetical protein